MTIQDFIQDCKKEGLSKIETLETLRSWLEENCPYDNSEAVWLVEEYYK